AAGRAQPAPDGAAVPDAERGSLLRGAPDRRRAPLEDIADAEPQAGRRAPLEDARSVEPRAGAAPEAEALRAAAPAPRAPTAAPAPAAGTARVVDTLDLGTTSITGNQELPKVLYIVPWKRSDLGELVGRPANTLLDEVLAPIDPEVFERHLDYYDRLYGTATEKE